MLLQERTSGALLLVAACHLESGKPGSRSKVLRRKEEVISLVSELERTLAWFAARSIYCGVIVGGDFNALREEFVLGNGAAFFACPPIKAVQPPLKPSREEVVLPPDPPLARIGSRGELHLRCAPADSGWLQEVSGSSIGAHPTGSRITTRSGSSMVIDYIFVGSVGCVLPIKGEKPSDAAAATDATTDAPTGSGWAAQPLAGLSEADTQRVSDPEGGVMHCIETVGSDHLPILVTGTFPLHPPLDSASDKEQRRSLTGILLLVAGATALSALLLISRWRARGS